MSVRWALSGLVRLARRYPAGATFGMRVLRYDIVEIDHVFIQKLAIQMTTSEALLATSDFVSVNCDLNPTTAITSLMPEH